MLNFSMIRYQEQRPPATLPTFPFMKGVVSALLKGDPQRQTQGIEVLAQANFKDQSAVTYKLHSILLKDERNSHQLRLSNLVLILGHFHLLSKCLHKPNSSSPSGQTTNFPFLLKEPTSQSHSVCERPEDQHATKAVTAKLPILHPAPW